jgi:hypothetical protein
MKVALLFLFTGMFSVVSQAQEIHHQMTSSQGKSMNTSNNLFDQQTVGQQSAIGNYFGSAFSVGQGFQQGKISNIKGTQFVNIQITAFPNPFSSKINFQFSASVDGPIKINFYDVRGKLVMTAENEMINKVMSLENLNFPFGQYIVNLSGKNFNYTFNLLKN